ncbi:CHAD domain-containing protein [bacterium]|nr:CHAD domain-containing protein [candidate division CSSED10-310 bacterium]
MTLYDAVRDILEQQIRQMTGTIPGVIADLDPEPLHDFRVAARRMRAVLNQVKPAIDPVQRRELARIIQEMAAMTNTKRDLDVFMESVPSMAALIPDDMQHELSLFRRRIARRRLLESRRIIAVFCSEAFRIDITRIESMIVKSGAILPGPGASLSVDTFAKDRIAKRCRRVVRDGRSIRRGILDHQMHAFRIQCKKFRYLLEFFTPVFSDIDVHDPIRRLKTLQTLLGDYNDISVQVAMIQCELTHNRRLTPAAAAMLNTLTRELQDKKDGMLIKIRRVFRIFLQGCRPVLAGSAGGKGAVR